MAGETILLGRYVKGFAECGKELVVWVPQVEAVL